MTARLAGMGWMTPLGAGLDEVCTRIRAGDRGETRELARPGSAQKYRYLPVPPALTKALERQPRLRRSSVISLLTAAAGLAALENAGITMSPEVAERIAVVFAIGDGGVIYTRRFYEQIVTQGANAASPLLFPETVYNAPASHLAALLGITGMSYTLVGDSSVGVSALHYGAQLLATSDVDYVVVIGGEEIDWVLCEAYREWRLIPSDGGGMLLSEGAAAVVLGREGAVEIGGIHPGVPFYRRPELGAALRKALGEAAGGAEVGLVVGSPNGTFIDEPERAVIDEIAPIAERLFPKTALGESPGASALMQTIVAARAVQKGDHENALVSCAGLNQQAAGLLLRRA